MIRKHFSFFFLAIFSLAFVSCTQKKETVLRIAYPSSGTIINAQVGLIFEKTPILKNLGLNATLHPMSTGREMKIALVSNEVDVIMTSEANFVVLLGEGFGAKAINSLGSAGRLGLVVNKDSKIKSLTDLKGKTIATIFGTSLHQPALAWAKQAGGAEVVNMSQIGAMMAALKAGKVDAVVTWDPYLEDAADGLRILAKDSFDLITVASTKFTEDYPDRITKLNQGFREAVFYLAQNKNEVNKWFGQMSNVNVAAIDRASRENKNYSASSLAAVDLKVGEAFRKRLNATGEFLFEQKIIRLKPVIEAQILD